MIVPLVRNFVRLVRLFSQFVQSSVGKKFSRRENAYFAGFACQAGKVQAYLKRRPEKRQKRRKNGLYKP